MKKAISFTVLIFATTISMFGQANCDETKKENEYLKKALKVNTPAKTASGSKIDFNLLRCEGNSKEQTVTLVLTVVNHDANKIFQFSEASAIDVEANEYKTYKINLGSADTRNTIYTDTPVKTTIQFPKILPSAKILKLISVEYYSDTPGKTLAFEFRDIPVTWL